MKHFLLILAIALTASCYGQVTVDTTGATVTVKEKTGATARTLTIFRSFVQGSGMRNQAVYQPVADEFGEEPETLRLTFAAEAPHIKTMLDAALAKKPMNFSKISLNILPYSDLIAKLADIFSTSPEWNDYLKKNAANLKTTTTLFDGSEVSEVAFSAKAAATVLDKSNFLKEISDLFAPYGYTVSSEGFPDEHQQILSTDKLMLMGKDPNLFVPVPNYSFTLTKKK